MDIHSKEGSDITAQKDKRVDQKTFANSGPLSFPLDLRHNSGFVAFHLPLKHAHCSTMSVVLLPACCLTYLLEWS